MGINLEFAKILGDLSAAGRLDGIDSVIEFGAQHVAVDSEVLSSFLAARNFPSASLRKHCDAPALYGVFGIGQYSAIDATGSDGALVMDLNKNLQIHYGYAETAPLVTNLGTTEHCFDQSEVFRNLHQSCRPNGLMIHAVPSQGWVNHGFYNYHPRFFRELASANNYVIEGFYFTVDIKSELKTYTH